MRHWSTFDIARIEGVKVGLFQGVYLLIAKRGQQQGDTSWSVHSKGLRQTATKAVGIGSRNASNLLYFIILI
jgi:hypothetical protein